MIPDQKDYDIILGLSWMMSQDVVLAPSRAKLEIGISNTTLWSENLNV